MNKKINLLWGFCISMLFFSCDPACYNSVSITVSNVTDKKLIIYCEYPLGPSTTVNCFDSVFANESNILISSYSTGPSIGAEYYYHKLWLYNQYDSTYIVCTNFKTGENELENSIYFDNLLQVRGKNGKNNIQNYSTEFTYVINYSLLTKMTKDTHLTDSIFGLSASQ